MRFRYSYLDGVPVELRLMPLLPCVLTNGKKRISAIGLVDSGAMMNVLPHQLGIDLGGIWNDEEAEIALGSVYAGIAAMPFVTMIQIGKFSPVRLAFAWAASNDVRLVLGQANFFMEFDVHFYRSKFEFEINPGSK